MKDALGGGYLIKFMIFIIKYNNIEYIKQKNKKSVTFNIINKKCTHFTEANNKSEWTIYEDGHAKFDIFGFSKPIRKSLIGLLLAN